MSGSFVILLLIFILLAMTKKSTPRLSLYLPSHNALLRLAFAPTIARLGSSVVLDYLSVSNPVTYHAISTLISTPGAAVPTMPSKE